MSASEHAHPSAALASSLRLTLGIRERPCQELDATQDAEHACFRCSFDLRYVPDSEDFSKREVREVATSVPSGYKPPEVGIAAMLHTNPKLTWDAEDEGRKKMLHKRVSKEELRDDDFKVRRYPNNWKLRSFAIARHKA